MMISRECENILLTRLKEVPDWKSLTDEELVDFVKEILIRFDIRFQYLGVEYGHLSMIGKWDPDANYTPCEHQMHCMAKLFELDYNKDIAPEAYKRIQEWKARLDEVNKERGAEE